MRAHNIPIEAAGVATHYLCDVMKRQSIGLDAKVIEQLLVHLMLSKPKGKHRHLVRKVEQLYTVELIDTYHRTHYGTYGTLTSLAELLQTEDVHFQQSKRLVGDDEEVATAAGRVEELHTTYAG